MHAATPAAPEPNSTGGNGGGWPTASGGTGSATTGDGTVSNCRAGLISYVQVPRREILQKSAS
jgi:hypothetical protein